MKEIVVISGKGGTGKTSITAAYSQLGGQDIVVADCDVDAADMHLVMKPDLYQSEDFYSGEIAHINQEECINCNICQDVCRFNAIRVKNNKYSIDPITCEGCGYCARVCPTEAIINEKRLVGQWCISSIKTGSTMVHAKLDIGGENSGKLAAKVKNEARQIATIKGKQFVIVDGSPGIGCPVISSLSGASFVILVTEPTISGIHDLKRIYKLVKKFNLKAGCVINKSDLNLQITEEIIEFLGEEDIAEISKIPYSSIFTEAISVGKTVIEMNDHELKSILIESWITIKGMLN